MKRNKFVTIAIAAVAALATAHNLVGQTTWNWTGAANGNWNNAGNWTPGGGVGFGIQNFTGSSNVVTNQNVSNPFNTHRIFLNSSANFVINGNPIHMFDFSGNDPKIETVSGGGSLTFNATVVQADTNDPLELNAVNGNLTFTDLQLTANHQVLTYNDNNRVLTVQGVLSGNSNWRIEAGGTGSGTVAFTGASANTWMGNLEIHEGVVLMNKNAGVTAYAGNNIFVAAGGTGTTPATLRLGNSNQIADNAQVFLRAGGTFDLGSNSDTINSLIFSNANTTNTTAPVVNGTGTLSLTATTNSIVREDYTQNIGPIVINSNVTFTGATAQIVNNDIEIGTNPTGNIVFNGNVTGNNKTIQILGNGSDNANVVWSGNQSGLVSSTVIIGESTTSAATRQGRLIMTSQNAIPDPSTTFVLERGSLQFNSAGTLSSSNNIIVRDNAPIPGGNLSIQGPQFHGAYSYIEAQTGGSTLNLHGNITVENSAVTANSNGWKHKLQFVDSFGTNESVIHLQGTNNFNGIESSIITGQLRFANQAAVGNTPAQQMSQLTIGQNIVANSAGGSTPGLNYGNDTGVIVNGGATMGAHLHIAQNQATTGPNNVGNRYIGTTDTTGTVTFSGSITFGVSVVDTSNSSTVAPNGNTTLDVRAPGTSTVVLSGTIGERTGFSGTSTLLINPVPGSGSHPHAGYTAPNNTPGGLSGTVRLEQAANSNAAAPDRIWIDGGTLLKTQHNQIGNDTAMVLNGGTFATGGFNEGGSTAGSHGMGALTLSANSTLDMGNGASFVHWNGYTNFTGNTNTLTINNYTGVPHLGNTNTDRIYFSGTPGGFSAGEYYDTRFVFTGFASGYKIIQHSANLWEVVPIPEPSTYAAIVLLILAVAYRERKRLRIAWAKISK